MAEKTFFVKRGWIIAKDAFGNMLPFFLHVRDKDIIWQSGDDEFLEKVVRDRDIKNIGEIAPKKLINYTSNNWDVTVDYYNHLCTLKIALNFDTDTFVLNDDKNNLYSMILLPLALVDNSRLNIQTHLSTESLEVASSIVSVRKKFDNVSQLIHNITVNVFNVEYGFPPTYFSMEKFNNSTIYVEISGEFTDY